MKEIMLAHGNGGVMSSQIIDEVILKNLKESRMSDLNDSAMVYDRIGFTTDSFVIYPHFFRGGDIGKLSVCGTVNDLVMSGCVPKFLSLSFILEEGFEIEKLEQIVKSVKDTCKTACVEVVTGDTKVVEKGSGSGIYINTSGIGEKISEVIIDKKRIENGDKIIITGNIGDHGVSILCERENMLKGQLSSDCKPLTGLIPLIEKYRDKIKVMRDPTRGGVATTLNELLEGGEYSAVLYEETLPIDPKVQGACELFGFDPLYSANEGKAIIVVHQDAAEEFLRDLRKEEEFKEASIIGDIDLGEGGRVFMKSALGGRSILGKLTSDILPRIC